jgi:hypothetical protein
MIQRSNHPHGVEWQIKAILQRQAIYGGHGINSGQGRQLF